MLPESDIEPLEDLPDAEDLTDTADRELLDRVVVLKLNGGLGTSMGMTGPKSLLEVKDGCTFLDLIARQLIDMRRRSGARLPLVLMNSFATREASLAALERYPELRGDVPLDFVQGKVPEAAGRRPLARWSGPRTRRSSGRRRATATSTRRWSPRACSTSCSSTATSTRSSRTWTTSARRSSRASSPGSRARGCRSRWRRPTAPRPTARAATRRGCATAGALVLRETAQTPEEDLEALQDTARHRYFNANNLWLSLSALRETLGERDGVLGLPMIVNRKTVDPGGPVVAGGDPARDRHGRGGRRLRGRRRDPGAAASASRP